jgi:hypothetical protein
MVRQQRREREIREEREKAERQTSLVTASSWGGEGGGGRIPTRSKLSNELLVAPAGPTCSSGPQTSLQLVPKP